MRSTRPQYSRSLLLIFSWTIYSASGFVSRRAWTNSRRSTRVQSQDTAILECATIDETIRLKQRLLEYGASYDRGYGASVRVRQDVSNILQELERWNPETEASQGIDENSSTDSRSPLKGSWQMIWTTALDVLTLQASPILSPGAIYQVFDPPVVTNIIDFYPRLQSAFGAPDTVLRAKVQTRASARAPNRVGLVFEQVQLRPLQVLGQTIGDWAPPFQVDLPRLFGGGSGPGYFDVTYLDSELLVIRQNAPGGVFVLRRVESIDV